MATARTVIGVDPGIRRLATAAVMDLDGHTGRVTHWTWGPSLGAYLAYLDDAPAATVSHCRRARSSLEGAAYDAARAVVDLAASHGAQVVMQDCREAPASMPRLGRVLQEVDEERGTGVSGAPSLRCLPVDLFEGLVRDRLRMRGLAPPVVRAFPYRSTLCVRCLTNYAGNRMGADFHCYRCGHDADADDNAAVVIATVWAMGWQLAAARGTTAERELESMEGAAPFRAPGEG